MMYFVKILFRSPFSDSFLQELYTTRPALTYVLANDCLTLCILLARQKWERGPALSFGSGLDWDSTSTAQVIPNKKRPSHFSNPTPRSATFPKIDWTWN